MKTLEPGRGYRFRLRGVNREGLAGPVSASVVNKPIYACENADQDLMGYSRTYVLLASSKGISICSFNVTNSLSSTIQGHWRRTCYRIKCNLCPLHMLGFACSLGRCSLIAPADAPQIQTQTALCSPSSISLQRKLLHGELLSLWLLAFGARL